MELPGFAKKQQHPESATLFVGNLPFDATEDELRDSVEVNASAITEDTEKEPKEGGDGQKALPSSGRGGQRSGLRKVRLGAFEDTGRCKGLVTVGYISYGYLSVQLRFPRFPYTTRSDIRSPKS